MFDDIDKLIDAMCGVQRKPQDSTYAKELCERAGLLEEWQSSEGVDRYQVVRRASFHFGKLII